MPNSIRTRRPNRLHLFFVALDMLGDRDWFSARQLGHVVYYGRGVPHGQQMIYLRERLDDCVNKGLLVRDDTIAACPLYRSATPIPRNCTGLVFEFLVRMHPEAFGNDQLHAIAWARADLPRFAPHTPTLADYEPSGRLRVPAPHVLDPHLPFPASSLPEA